ncbi:MAG: hypothetical protein ACT4QD_02955 [Acidobacteriota bacterium]
MFRGTVSLFLVTALGAAAGIPALGQQPPTNGTPQQPTGILGGKSPPQPIQPQRLDYFVGTWTFKWTGREGPLSAGPRAGTVSYARLGDTAFLGVSTEGKVDGGGAYKEGGTLGWHEAQKIIALQERILGHDVLSIGDWTSPLSIRFEGAPVVVQGETVRIRRTVGIVSAQSFTVSEELSTNGGPFVRMGGGVFSKR